MQQLGYNNWKGRKLVLFVCTKVGFGILFQAHIKGAEVTVVSDTECLNPDIKNYTADIIDYRDLPRITKALSDTYAIVTATGKKKAPSKILA